MKFTDLFTSKPKLSLQVELNQSQHDARQRRLADPLLDYWNKDVRWVVCEVNMGPGGEYFTGYELHAIWNRPEESQAASRTVFTSQMPPVKYSAFDYRIVAIGLSGPTCMRLSHLRNLEVLRVSDVQ